ncbi:putative phosphatase [Streptomyces sp. RB5]|uniref:Putative phosphatase n=1 Tax=Streptomyces smaragdinus TaxID=2585196 RepID=A0A7K0CQH9_9ACTN|nr:phosphatase [Streptomyces smaragdinus]MQY15719.1 putative phosphatase [Streptomyces smaragdinus]
MLTDVDERTALKAHLLRTGIAGCVATTRDQSLRRYALFAARDPRALLGLEPERDWSVADLLRLMAERCGVSPDPGRISGSETIDPDRTIDALDAFAGRLAAAVRRREAVLVGTGHPGGLQEFYAPLATAVSAAGCHVLTPGEGRDVDITTRFGVRTFRLSYVDGVAVLREPGAGDSASGAGVHTHSPLPVRAALAAAAAGPGPLPDLVVGDHGWACGAGQLGFETMGAADADDPALFVGQREGRLSVVVPLDDAVRSDYYRPLTRYVLNRACLSQ